MLQSRVIFVDVLVSITRGTVGVHILTVKSSPAAPVLVKGAGVQGLNQNPKPESRSLMLIGVWGLGFRVWGLGFRASLGFRVFSGFTVQGSAAGERQLTFWGWHSRNLVG